MDNPKVELTKLLELEIFENNVNNRADVIKTLREYGEITRTGKGTISIKPPGATKAIRLRGSIYDEQFNGELYRATEAKTPGQGTAGREKNNGRAGYHRGDLTEAIERRQKYHRERYHRVVPAPDKTLDESPGLHPAVVSPGDPDPVHRLRVDQQTHREQNQRPGRLPGRSQEIAAPGLITWQGDGRMQIQLDKKKNQKPEGVYRRRNRWLGRRDQEEMTDDRTRNEVTRCSEISAIHTRAYIEGIERYRKRARRLRDKHQRLKQESRSVNLGIRAMHLASGLIAEANVRFTAVI